MATRTVKIPNEVLFLTEDPDLLKRQLQGEKIRHDPARPLINNISTDELTPGWVCYWYDETLGHYCLVGLRGGVVQKDALFNRRPAVVVSGLSKGCGSSRETAPYSELVAGVKLVVAKTIEKIYGQNCQNIGLLTSTDFSLLERIERDEEIPMSEFTRGLDPISAGIVENGGLFAYNRRRLAGEVSPPAVTTAARPMTVAEKVIARNAIVDAKAGKLGVTAVQPGDALFCKADLRFTHEYVTPMAEALFTANFGKEGKVRDVSSVVAFRDHLTFLGQVMTQKQKDMGLLKLADDLAVVQSAFTQKQGIRLYGEVKGADGKVTGSEAICHNGVLEDLALPGQLVIGSDSHTCTAGAIGCFAFGVGATDMANAWFTGDIRVTVPRTVRYNLVGEPSKDICAKDIILNIMAQDYIKSGKAIGQVLEFGGPAVARLNLDERATLTNMAVEAGATTGIVEADETTVRYLVDGRGLKADDVRKMLVHADKGAAYAAEFTIDLAKIRPVVALPGDPRNGVELPELQEKKGRVKVDIAYGGSCTGGKKTDMDMYASVLAEGLKRGMKVRDDVAMYIQFGSQKIKQYAVQQGYLEVFARSGARVIEPSCGACIKAGPGVSFKETEVTVSAINRNFPGRSGPGDVYLASPFVVAASALAGHITSPEELFKA
ncbi:MAG: 3-isopropylmalate dehydratase [Deltaproteobacteria bacterium]|nr:3-isopropylmalate dehydratase [Deltaproteobacteria bacterium]